MHRGVSVGTGSHRLTCGHTYSHIPSMCMDFFRSWPSSRSLSEVGTAEHDWVPLWLHGGPLREGEVVRRMGKAGSAFALG